MKYLRRQTYCLWSSERVKNIRTFVSKFSDSGLLLATASASMLPSTHIFLLHAFFPDSHRKDAEDKVLKLYYYLEV